MAASATRRGATRRLPLYYCRAAALQRKARLPSQGAAAYISRSNGSDLRMPGRRKTDGVRGLRPLPPRGWQH